jgi:hypothetical protein
MSLSDKIIEVYETEMTGISARQKKNHVLRIASKYEKLINQLKDVATFTAAEIFQSEWFFVEGCDSCDLSKETVLEAIKTLNEAIEKSKTPFVNAIFQCDCGANISTTAKTKHFRSNKHLRYTENESLKLYKEKYYKLKTKIGEKGSPSPTMRKRKTKTKAIDHPVEETENSEEIHVDQSKKQRVEPPLSP